MTLTSLPSRIFLKSTLFALLGSGYQEKKGTENLQIKSFRYNVKKKNVKGKYSNILNIIGFV